MGVNKNYLIYNCRILNRVSAPTLLVQNLKYDTDTQERLKCLQQGILTQYIALNVNGSLLVSCNALLYVNQSPIKKTQMLMSVNELARVEPEGGTDRTSRVIHSGPANYPK